MAKYFAMSSNHEKLLIIARPWEWITNCNKFTWHYFHQQHWFVLSSCPIHLPPQLTAYIIIKGYKFVSAHIHFYRFFWLHFSNYRINLKNLSYTIISLCLSKEYSLFVDTKFFLWLLWPFKRRLFVWITHSKQGRSRFLKQENKVQWQSEKINFSCSLPW